MEEREQKKSVHRSRTSTKSCKVTAKRQKRLKQTIAKNQIIKTEKERKEKKMCQLENG